MNGKGMEFDIFQVHIAQVVVFGVWGHHPISGLLEAMPIYTFGHQQSTRSKVWTTKTKILKRNKLRAPTLHMLLCILYLFLPLNNISLTVFRW
jgi:hypothetical protein